MKSSEIIISEIIAKVKELFENNHISLFIGYRKTAQFAVPAIIFSPAQLSRLYWGRDCYNNLALYLNHPEIKSIEGKKALIVKPCDTRAVRVLIKEGQVSRDSLYLLGIECPGLERAGKMLDKCQVCTSRNCADWDYVIETDAPLTSAPSYKYGDVEALWQETEAERWHYWLGWMERCLRCYACRQVCPLCYCTICFTEQHQPTLVESAPLSLPNLHFHLVRAWHLAGRCVECGECERVCPMGIPIMLLNKMISRYVEKKYGYIPGETMGEEMPFLTYSKSDREDFII